MQKALRIDLIGPLTVTRGDEILRMPGPRPSALLAMLALAPKGAVPRATLMDRFWGERPEAQAAGSLRQLLYALRQALGPDGARIGSAGSAVVLDLSGLETDVADLQALPPVPDRAGRRLLLASARRDLLAGLSVQADGAEDWLREVREGFRQDLAARLRAAAGASLAAGDREGARELGEGLLGLDPYCEETLALLLRLDAERGGRAAARQRFDRFARRVRAELGIAPSEALAELVRELERGGPRPLRMAERPAAEFLWTAGPGGPGFAAAARAILMEELQRAGIRIFAAPPPGDLPVPFTLRGEIATVASGQAVLLELLSPEREVLATARLGVRWPLDLSVFEAELAARARALAEVIEARSAAAPVPRMARSSAPLHAGLLGAFATLPEAAGVLAETDRTAAPAAEPVAAPDPVSVDLEALTGWTPPAFAMGAPPVELPALALPERAAGPEPDLFRFAGEEAEPSGPSLAPVPGVAAVALSAASPYAVVALEARWSAAPPAPAAPRPDARPVADLPEAGEADAFEAPVLAPGEAVWRPDVAWVSEPPGHAPSRGGGVPAESGRASAPEFGDMDALGEAMRGPSVDAWVFAA